MYQSRILTFPIESFFKILRKLGHRGSILVVLSQLHLTSLSLRSISELSGAASSCEHQFFSGHGGLSGRFFEAGRLFEVGAYSRLGT